MQCMASVMLDIVTRYIEYRYLNAHHSQYNAEHSCLETDYDRIDTYHWQRNANHGCLDTDYGRRDADYDCENGLNPRFGAASYRFFTIK